MTSTLAPVLSIAGSDSSGGAGIQADLKTMLANGVFGMTAIAALTAQNTTGVTMVTNTPPEMLAAQIDAVFEDIPPVAVKIGMVSSVELINVIADRLIAHDATNIVLDPVMVATSGAKLIEGDAIAALTSKLFPLATVITPNMPETQALCELAVEQGADAIDYENGESISSENDMVTAGHMHRRPFRLRGASSKAVMARRMPAMCSLNRAAKSLGSARVVSIIRTRMAPDARCLRRSHRIWRLARHCRKPSIVQNCI